MKNTLFIMSSYNVYGGTPKKTLDLMRHFQDKSHIYVYYNLHPDLKGKFEETGGGCHDGFYGRNLWKHLKALKKIVEDNNIEIIQTQFTRGESLGFLLKLLKPRLKLVLAFVGPFKPSPWKNIITPLFYTNVDGVIYVSEYIRNIKTSQYPQLKKKKSKIIYNGTKKRIDTDEPSFKMKPVSILAVAALIDWKNLEVLIHAMNIIQKSYKRREVYLYIAGEGRHRSFYENLIAEYGLEDQIILMGNQKNIGNLLNQARVFVHPSKAEAFGIAVAEAMMAGKPTIVSSAGALKELVDHKVNGLVLDPSNAEVWAKSILDLLDSPKVAENYGANAKYKAKKIFSVNKFVAEYESFYDSL